MKAQTKAIVASIVIMALAFSAVSGVTYSWFSDSEETNISITTGNIDLNATPDVLYIPNGGEKVEVSETQQTLDIGTSVKASSTSTNNAVSTVISVGNMTPGDKIVLTYDGTLSTTIKTIHKLAFASTSGFDISGDVEINSALQGETIPIGTTMAVSGEVIISFPTSNGNQYMGQNFNLGITLGVYQANIDPDNVIANSYTETKQTSTDTDTMVEVSNTENGLSANVTFAAGSLDVNTKSITVEALSTVASEDISYSLESNGNILGGVNVTFENGNLSDGSTATLVMKYFGEYSNVEVYHNGSPLTKVDNPDEADEYSVTIENGETIITVCAGGFSAYYAIDPAPVATIGDNSYYSLESAFKEISGTNDIIKLNRDILSTNPIVLEEGSTVNLDLNGHVISGSNYKSQGYLFMIKNGAQLTISDSGYGGKISFDSGEFNTGWIIDLEGKLLLESGILELTGSWEIGYAVDVRPNSWGTEYSEPTEFTMNGGKIVSSDGAVRVASSSADGHKNVSSSFIMNGGFIDAVWDGVFIQQSNNVYDVLNFTLNGGTIESDKYTIRIYGTTSTTGYVNGENCMTIVLNDGIVRYTGTSEDEPKWIVDESFLIGETVLNNVLKDTNLYVSDKYTVLEIDGYDWVTVSEGDYNGLKNLVSTPS